MTVKQLWNKLVQTTQEKYILGKHGMKAQRTPNGINIIEDYGMNLQIIDGINP